LIATFWRRHKGKGFVLKNDKRKDKKILFKRKSVSPSSKAHEVSMDTGYVPEPAKGKENNQGQKGSEKHDLECSRRDSKKNRPSVEKNTKTSNCRTRGATAAKIGQQGICRIGERSLKIAKAYLRAR